MGSSASVPFSVESLPDGEPVNIAGYTHVDDGIVPIIDVEKVMRVIRENSAEQMPVYTLGIAGVCRSGKSFLVNLLLHFLYWKQRNKKKPRKEWKSSGTPITGFYSKNGRTAVTKGIWMWDRIFKITPENAEPYGLVIIDSQGIGDNIHSSDPKVDDLIIQLTMAFSHLMIFNIDNYFRIEDLTIFQACSLIQQVGNRRLPLNKTGSLMPLHRNFAETGHVHGIQPDMWEKDYKVPAAESATAKALKIYEAVEESFEHIYCATLPHPGDKIAGSSDCDNMNVKDLKQGFTKALQNIFTQILDNQAELNRQTYHKYFNGSSLIHLAEHLSESLTDVVVTSDMLNPIGRGYYILLTDQMNARLGAFREELLKIEKAVVPLGAENILTCFEESVNDLIASTLESFYKLSSDTTNDTYRQVLANFESSMLIEKGLSTSRLEVYVKQQKEADHEENEETVQEEMQRELLRREANVRKKNSVKRPLSLKSTLSSPEIIKHILHELARKLQTI